MRELEVLSPRPARLDWSDMPATVDTTDHARKLLAQVLQLGDKSRALTRGSELLGALADFVESTLVA